jgi:hypothetical protein
MKRIVSAMSETAVANGRDGKTGQFVTGSNGGPGRRVGSRNRLGEQFVLDLKTVWAEDGIDALRRCAREDATGFCRIVAGLMPKTLDVNMTAEISVGTFAEQFRAACAMLGNDLPPHNEPKPVKTIEHADARLSL